MTLEEQKIAEEKIRQLREDLTVAEKAILYKTFHVEGLRITACEALIRREPAPVCASRQKTVSPSASLPHGLSSTKFP